MPLTKGEERRSKCCGATLHHHEKGITYYDCDKCGFPCDWVDSTDRLKTEFREKFNYEFWGEAQKPGNEETLYDDIYVAPLISFIFGKGGVVETVRREQIKQLSPYIEHADSCPAFPGHEEHCDCGLASLSTSQETKE